jgi:hypothetical protein
MKRALYTLRLLAGTLLIVMGFLAISPAAHAAPMASAARSVSVTFRNNTTHNLNKRYSEVFTGVWTHEPKIYVSPTEEFYWGTASNGFMTGTSGIVWYDMADGKYFTVKWNNPYVGSNSYTFGGTALKAGGGFRIVQSGGSGNNAQVILTLQPN